MAERCYRHPDRETGVSCSNCGRPICPECMTSTPVGMRCPECAGQRTPVRTGIGGGSEVARATFALLAINIAAFVAQLAAGGGAGSVEGGGQLIRDGGLLGPSVADGEWYRIVTAGFLHAGPLHLLMNMFVLYVLGTLLEPAIGTGRFIAIYAVSLLAGSCGALLLDPNTITVGASGGIYGLMAATIIIARRRGLEQVSGEIGLWLVLNLALTFSIPGISIGGHLGGLAGGAVAALVVLAAERRAAMTPARAVEVAALVALGALVFLGALLAAG